VATRARCPGLSAELNGLVRELQNCSQRAQNDKATNDRLHDRLQERTPTVFRPHEQGVGRFFGVAVWLARFRSSFSIVFMCSDSFHRHPILAVQLDAGSGNPSDCIVSGDRLPVTLSCLAI
jgi:hypothetical protein